MKTCYNMVLWSNFTVILIVILNVHIIHSSDLLNITKETIDLGQKFIHEAEEKTIYRNFDDVINKLEKIYKIFISHGKKIFRNQVALPRVYYDSYRTIWYGIAKEVYDIKSSTLSNNYFFNINIDRFSDSDFDILFSNEAEKLELDAESKIRNMKEIFFQYKYKLMGNIFNLTTKPNTNERLNKLHKLLQTKDDETNETFLDVLSRFQVDQVSMSPQQFLWNELKSTILADIIEYTLTQYSYTFFKIYSDAYDFIPKNYENRRRHNFQEAKRELLYTWKEENVITKMKNLNIEFTNRNLLTYNSFKEKFIKTNVSREFWNSVLKYEYAENGHVFQKIVEEYDKSGYADALRRKYTILENLFQMYIINEVDLNKDGSCIKQCSTYSEAKVHGCYDKGLCNHQATCDGNLWGCQDQIAPIVTVCPRNNMNGTWRYLYMQANNERYGNDLYACTNELITAQGWPRGFYKCSYCICTCDSSNVPGDRYFNLRNATSDLDSNYVVTDVRFQKVNHVVHIQIKQGKLLQHGLIDQDTIHWKPIENYTISDRNITNGKDFHTITGKEKTVLLDDLDMQKNHVLTGLKFGKQNGFLKLEIRVTHFDFATGTLGNSHWISKMDETNDLSERSEIRFNDENKFTVYGNGSLYLHFTTTDLKRDVGQHTLPFLETTGTYHNPSVPLSGARIVLKSRENFGHFLGLAVFTHDISPYL